MTACHQITRPLTPRERELLAAYGEPYGKPSEAMGQAAGCTFFIALILYSAIMMVWRWVAGCDCDGSRSQTVILVSASFAFLLTWPIWRTLLKSVLPQPVRPDAPHTRDLAGGVAQVLTADVTRYVEVYEYEDEGLGFFIELADGRVLALVGQDYYPYAREYEPDPDEPDERGSFPTDRIEYAFAPETGIDLGCTPLGRPLAPLGYVETTRAHFSVRDGAEPLAPVSGNFEDGPLEAVLQRHRYVLQPFD